jgi:hypothetical protein
MRFERVQIAIFAAACGLAVTAGCTTTRTRDAYAIQCTDTAPTGSHIARTRCWRKIDIEERQRRDYETMEKIQYRTSRRKDVR